MIIENGRLATDTKTNRENEQKEEGLCAQRYRLVVAVKIRTSGVVEASPYHIYTASLTKSSQLSLLIRRFAAFEGWHWAGYLDGRVFFSFCCSLFVFARCRFHSCRQDRVEGC